LITVATYNIFHSAIPETKRIDYNKYASVIKGLGADLVALQEVDYKTRRSSSVDQATKLAQLAGYPYVKFGKSMSYDRGYYGNAILSKHPLSSETTYPIAKVSGEPRCLICATATFPDGKTVRFGSTHLGLIQAERMIGVGVIAAQSKNSPPTIIAGDFNAGPNSIEMRCLPGFYNRASDEALIDQVLYKGPVQVLEHQVIPDGNGDHEPVVVKFQWN
jgi:endonuclease/exonuclease/phosphatase family metal-dependent hydrolase